MIYLLLGVFVNSCAVSSNKEARYLNKILFDSKYLDNWKQKEERYRKIYIDSQLVFRPTIYPESFFTGTQDTFFIEDKLYGTNPIILKIPRKWRNTYLYFDGDIVNALTKDSTSVMFMSPLLKSELFENRYYIQQYIYQKTHLEEYDKWILMRCIRKFEIRKGKIKELELEYMSADIIN